MVALSECLLRAQIGHTVTIIASFDVGESTVLIGDAAISSDIEKPELDRNVPTRGPLRPYMSATGGVDSLGQKLVLISDTCAVAWAGDADSSRVFLGDMRSMHERGELEDARVREYALAKTREFRQLAFLVCTINHAGRVLTVRHNTRAPVSTPVGNMHWAGAESGMKAIRRCLARAVHPARKLSADITSRGSLPRMIRNSDGAAAGLLVGGALIWKETIDGSSLLDRYGGAYEVICSENGVFSKVDNVAFVFTTVDVSNPDIRTMDLRSDAARNLIRNNRAWWSRYNGSRLRVSTLDWGTAVDAGSPRPVAARASHEFGEYLDPHVFTDTAPDEFDEGLCAAPWLCWHIALVRNKRVLDVVPAVVAHELRVRTQRNSHMRIFREPGLLNFSIAPQLIEGVILDACRYAGFPRS